MDPQSGGLGPRRLRRVLLHCSDISPSREDAQQVCDALDRAGVVLRVKDLVYLRPLEVAEILYQVNVRHSDVDILDLA